ncbi:hypothetical protein PQX77_019499 [Marasmius sp. AFHP31]|nr:hypothetical protein PQX77_019499 [Marasmius sp. AFHP31]
MIIFWQQLTLVLFALISSSAASQNAFFGPPHVSVSQNVVHDNENFFTPVESLEFVSETDFTSLRHPLFPNHSARIKKSRFCDHTVNAYTGYIDITGARHLFFYFFESRSDPDKDDVIFWTNGGPGASSTTGLFMELGPCRIVNDTSVKFNPHSWNTKANIFFIEQPVGTGFSYAEFGESVSTTEEAAQDVAAFVAIFFENFSKFKGRPLHMAGESYGGRYIPVFASAIYDQNVELIEAGLTPVNLSSIMIGKLHVSPTMLPHELTHATTGNGGTDFWEFLWSHYDFACTEATLPPVLSISTCVRMKQIVARCKKWTKAACVDQYDVISCGAAAEWCQIEIDMPYLDTGLNPYDYSRKCEGEYVDTLCYPITKHINAYLSDPHLRKQLGVDSHPSIPKNYSGVSWDVKAAFDLSQDFYHTSNAYVAALLERGIRALIYVGTYDWVCNYIGIERWMLDLEWMGRDGFREGDLREWYISAGKVAGKSRTFGGLTYATIDAAGHMAPYDKPEESLELVNRWLAGEAL